MKYAKIIVMLLVFVIVACSEEKQKTPQNLAKNDLEILNIYSSENNKLIRSYNVEVAQTKDKLYKGLMGRVSLAENSGMIFDVNIIPADVEVVMWMKDTPLPLDMLFIDANAKIYYIKENAVPYSTVAIKATSRPRAVLEVNAGQVKKYGIRIGDIVEHEMLRNNMK